MHHLPHDTRRAFLGGLVGSVDVEGGPTDEQRALLDAVGTHVFRLHADDVEPLDPAEVAEVVTEPALRRMLAEAVIAFDLTRRSASHTVEHHVEGYLAALGAGEELTAFVRDHVHDARDKLAADYARIAETSTTEPDLEGTADRELVARLDALADCAPGTVGRSFYDYYQRHGFAWPVGHESLVRHDFDHVLAGYEAVAEGELALQAMLTASAGGANHYSGLLASLLLYEVGAMPVLDIEPTTGALARPGAADLFGDAIARGLRCRGDFGAVDHLALADRDLQEARAELGIEAPTPGPATFVV